MQSSRQRSAVGTLLRVFELLAWTAFFAFAAVFLLLRFWLLPQIDRYQEEVATALTHAVGLPVKIGRLHAEWDGLHPRLSLTDLRVFDRDGREALVLPTVEPVVAWTTLLAWDLRLHSLAIDGPRLKVRRTAEGLLAVAGIELQTRGDAGRGESRLTDWVLEQRDIVIRNAEIEWLDEQRGAPPLVLRGLQFRLRNRGELHQIGLSARPPQDLGAGLEVRAALIGRSVTQPEAWNGRVYAEVGTIDLAGWRAWIDYPIEVDSGHGALRLWATFGAGKLVDATADLALSGVAARLGQDLPMLRVNAVAGRVQGRQTAQGYEFGARGLTLVPERGPALRDASFQAGWDATEPPRGRLAAARIDLEPLAQLADYLPFPADLRRVLAELEPRGRVSDAHLEWQGELPDAARFQLRARFEALGMQAWRAFPGFANFSGRIDSTQAKGSVTLATRDAEILLPRVFAEPIVHLAALSGEVSWERQAGDGVNVRLVDLRYANDDAAGTASGHYTYTGKGPGVIDLSAQLSRAEAGALPRYLPLPGIMGAQTREWLVRSIQAGHSPDLRLRLRGDLRHFPFRDPRSGQFDVVAQLRNGVLAYADDWPVIEEIQGELRIERDRLEILARSARVLGAGLSDARAELTLREPVVLQVSGQAEGPSNEFLAFISRSPLQQRLGNVAENFQVAGRGRLGLELRLPLAELERTEVDGEFVFGGNTVRVGSWLPVIDRAEGALAFTRSSIQVRTASGRFMGGPLRVIGGTQRGGGVVLSLGGRFTAAALEPLLPARWQGRMQGSAAYAGSVRLAQGIAPQLALESDLAGVSVDLPPPFAKRPSEVELLRVAFLQGEDGERDRVSVTLGRQMRAEILRRREGRAMVLERGAVAFHLPPGAPLRMPERPERVLLHGSLPHADLDAWLSLLATGGGDATESPGLRADMSFGALDAFGRRLRDISVDARLAGGGWTAKLNSKDIAGEVDFRGGDNPKLIARMARFVVPEETPGASPGEAARKLPDVDLVAEEFGYRGRQWGRVAIVANHDGPVWKIDQLSVTSPEGSLAGTGQWRTEPAPSTELSLALMSIDVGRFLERMGHPGLVRGGNARANAELAWSGAPMAIDYPSLSGIVQLHAEDGRFLEVDPGAGKLISLMSLQMLPRRITLDFRDVFSEGFEWNSIEATARIAQGMLATQDFRMSGSGAEVAMQGQVDLARETQDLRVRVVPALDSTASTAAALMVNPVVGLTTFLAQKLLQNPLGQMFAFEYGISGGWADPKVERIGPVAVESPKPPTGD